MRWGRLGALLLRGPGIRMVAAALALATLSPAASVLPGQPARRAAVAPSPRALAIASSAGTSSGSAFSFVHPGMLYTVPELTQMRQEVQAGQSPWLHEWHLLQANPLAMLSFTPTFDSVVYRNDAVHGNTGNYHLQSSGSAALLDAIEWDITSDPAYAQHAAAILDGWSSTLTAIQGHDQQLAASLYGYKMLNAAEILRASYPGWHSEDQDKFTTMMASIFYPIVSTYGYVNGGWANGNWDAADIVFAMCFGIWSNNEQVYDQAVNYYKNGDGNGSLLHYVQTPYGQAQESGRDQAHTQLGLGMLALAAEVGWTQRQTDSSGADMYSYPDNSYRLLTGIEYTAEYNLGYPVAYTPMSGVGYTLSQLGTATYIPRPTISPVDRGQFRPIYYQVYRFYHEDIGVPQASVADVWQVIQREPLERFHYDEPSYGGLLNGFAMRSAQATATTVSVATPYRSSGKGTLSTMVQVPNRTDTVLTSGDGTPLSEDFQMVYLGASDEFAFRSLLTGKYLEVQGEYGAVVADGDSVGPAETFRTPQEITLNGNGDAWGLQSAATGKYVIVDQYTGELYANGASATSGNGEFIAISPSNLQAGSSNGQ